MVVGRQVAPDLIRGRPRSWTHFNWAHFDHLKFTIFAYFERIFSLCLLICWISRIYRDWGNDSAGNHIPLPKGL